MEGFLSLKMPSLKLSRDKNRVRSDIGPASFLSQKVVFNSANPQGIAVLYSSDFENKQNP
jgi:hypothetical protein